MTARLPFRGHRFGRILVTTCMQPTGAPTVDDGFTRDQEGRRYASKVVLLTPWRRNRFGEHAQQRAVVIGWRT